MKVLKIVSVLVVVAGLAAAAVMAQGRSVEPSQKRAFAFNMFAGSRLGVSARDLDQAEVDRQKLAGGAVVEDVLPESPAAKAGLRRADVIVEFDGERVRSAQQFARLVQETPSGRTVKATIVRDGQRSDVQLTPSADRGAEMYFDGDQFKRQVEEFTARMPEFNFEMGVPPGEPRGRLGVTVSPLSDQLAAYFGAKEGVLVSAVNPGSAAERAGLKAGDVITTVNGERIRSSADISRAIRSAADNADVTIGIVREKKESSLKTRIEPRELPRSSRPI